MRTRFALAIVATTTACVSSGRADVARFAEATGKVHAQADAAFARANAVSRQAAIDLFVASRRPGLSERVFPAAIDGDTIAAWDAALHDLERYGGLLAELLDNDRGDRTAGAVASLGRELNTGRTAARIAPGVGAAFASLAGALADAKAAAFGRSIAVDADPAIGRLVREMGTAIGTDRTEGLQGTVWSNWTATLNGVRNGYAEAAEKGDEPRQRALVAEFLAGVDRRDADLRTLSSLRASLLALGDAHQAIAAGSAPGQAAIIGGIDRRLDAARRDMDALREGSR